MTVSLGSRDQIVYAQAIRCSLTRRADQHPVFEADEDRRERLDSKPEGNDNMGGREAGPREHNGLQVLWFICSSRVSALSTASATVSLPAHLLVSQKSPWACRLSFAGRRWTHEKSHLRLCGYPYAEREAQNEEPLIQNVKY
jgi:hypothetical protein